jgi:hypothetical protein
MADNQISVSIDADASELQAALRQAAAACQEAAASISASVDQIGESTKRNLEALAAEHQRYAESVRTIHRSAAGDISRIWDQAASQIDRALLSGFNRMIVSGGNLQAQMRKIAAQVETALLTAIEKTVLKWILGEDTKTAATVAGTAARSAAERSSEGVGLASMALKAIKAIANDAWQTFAGIFAFLSPEMGPAAAGPAAAGSATVMAVAGNIASAAGGAWSLPSDMLVFAHREESILPAHIAGPMRDFFTGASAGSADKTAGGDVNFHVYAMDSRDVMSFFKRNGGTIAKVLKGEQRNFTAALGSAFR